MIRTIPARMPPRMIVTMPQITRMTAMTHRIDAAPPESFARTARSMCPPSPGAPPVVSTGKPRIRRFPGAAGAGGPPEPVRLTHGQGLLLLRHRLRGCDERGQQRPRSGPPGGRDALRLQEHQPLAGPRRGHDRGPVLHGGPSEGGRGGPEGQDGAPRDPAEGALERAGPAGRTEHVPAERPCEPRHLRRQGPRDHEVREGPRREGAEPGPEG